MLSVFFSYLSIHLHVFFRDPHSLNSPTWGGCCSAFKGEADFLGEGGETRQGADLLCLLTRCALLMDLMARRNCLRMSVCVRVVRRGSRGGNCWWIIMSDKVFLGRRKWIRRFSWDGQSMAGWKIPMASVRLRLLKPWPSRPHVLLIGAAAAVLILGGTLGYFVSIQECTLSLCTGVGSYFKERPVNTEHFQMFNKLWSKMLFTVIPLFFSIVWDI